MRSGHDFIFACANLEGNEQKASKDQCCHVFMIKVMIMMASQMSVPCPSDVRLGGKAMWHGQLSDRRSPGISRGVSWSVIMMRTKRAENF